MLSDVELHILFWGILVDLVYVIASAVINVGRILDTEE